MNLTLRNNPIAPTLLALIRHFRTAPDSAATLTVKVDTGRTRAAMVAKYMEEQAVALRAAWDATVQFDKSPAVQAEAAMLQAGAAGAEAMSNLLHALLAGDKEEFKAHLTQFVNDAVDTGVVS